MSQAPPTFPSSNSDELLIAAGKMCAERRYEDAARVLADGLRKNEGAHALRYELSQVEAILDHLTSAERLAREATAAGGDVYARGLGYTLGQLGQFQEAEYWLLRALQYDSRDASAYANLAAIHGHQCRNSEALSNVERALSLRPDFPWAQEIRRTLLVQDTFLRLVRDTYVRFAQCHGLNPDPDATPDAEIEFPSAATDAGGTARFHMSIPCPLVLRDLGAAHLFYREVADQGYEFVLRKLIDGLLRSDDVFIDIGAHWGVHSLSAATRLPNEVNVLALEANPENSKRLAAWVKRNKLETEVEVIPKAAGDRIGPAHLLLNGSSMGHRIAPDGVEVEMTTLDRILADRDWLRWRRLILKVDVEGHEMEVLAGAQQLFSKCDVAAVIWEKSEFHERASQSHRNSMIFDFLGLRGFRHYRFEDETG